MITEDIKDDLNNNEKENKDKKIMIKIFMI